MLFFTRTTTHFLLLSVAFQGIVPSAFAQSVSCEQIEARVPDYGQASTSCTCNQGLTVAECALTYDVECQTRNCSTGSGFRCGRPEPFDTVCEQTTDKDTYEIPSLPTDELNLVGYTSMITITEGIQNIESTRVDYDTSVLGSSEFDLCEFSILKKGSSSDVLEKCNSCAVCVDGNIAHDCTNVVPEATIATCDTPFEFYSIFQLIGNDETGENSESSATASTSPPAATTTAIPPNIPSVTDTTTNGDEGESICTVLPDHEKLEQRLRYQTFKMPCPEVGKRINVEFEFRKTLREPDPDIISITKSSLSVTVAHEGTACPVAGISFGVTIADTGPDVSREFTCDDMMTDLDRYDRISGTDVRTGCRYWSGLSDLGGWCHSVGIGDAGTPEKKAVVSVWNDGGCEGNLIFDAVLSDDPASDLAIAAGEPASVCLSGFSQICEDFDGGVSNGTFDPNRVCGEEDTEDIFSSEAFKWSDAAFHFSWAAAILSMWFM